MKISTYALSTTLMFGAFGLSACSSGEEKPAETKSETAETAAPEVSVLQAIANADYRGDFRDRNDARHPVKTLEFFGLEPGMHVVEIWPGGGWFTSVLAPYAQQTGGTYTAALFPEISDRARQGNANFIEKFSDVETYGVLSVGTFGKDVTAILPDNMQADMVVTFRNTHSWMGGGYEKQAFANFYDTLKPGGTLGVVQHRLPAIAEQDPQARTGYVQQDYVILLAQEAGFEFVGASEVNANPNDTADHPFGVWTLPPVGRTAPRGEEPDPNFDAAKYQAIGESDRMTLKFRKPAE